MTKGFRKMLTFYCYEEIDKKLSFCFIQDMKILYLAASDKQNKKISP